MIAAVAWRRGSRMTGFYSISVLFVLLSAGLSQSITSNMENSNGRSFKCSCRHLSPQRNYRSATSKGDGIIGVIHKATQGTSGLDPMYVTNRGKAQAAGLLWGAYHFATGGDGVEQAQHFLDTVGTFQNTLLVLDLEQNPSGSSMTLE